MNTPQEYASVDVLFVEHFKTEEEAQAYAAKMLTDGHASCTFYTSPLGYFVCVLEAVLSE